MLRNLRNSHLTGEAGKLGKLQFTPAAKNPQPSVIASQLQSSGFGTFLYTGITISTGEVRTWLHLLCPTRQCTNGFLCSSNYGGTSRRQNRAENDRVCPQVCDVRMDGENAPTCLLSDSTLGAWAWGRLRPPDLTAVPYFLLRITSTVYPSQPRCIPSADAGRQSTKAVSVNIFAPTF